MEVFGFAVFLVVSHLGAMQIFKLTTYHAYFWKTLPLLVIYSAGVAWILYALEMHRFFLWQLILASVWLIYIGNNQAKMKESMLLMAGGDAEQIRAITVSTTKTSRYYMLSSFTYIVVFAATYLWLFNR